MSSLAASRADNFYFPPEWTPEMGGLSKYQGSKGANQYQQYGIVRFELPFDGWCLKCDRHICKGHRFNAKKDKIGKYFSTTLYSFSTKCPSVTCDQKFLIKTDPEHRTYDFAEGLRKMVQDFTPGADDSIIEVGTEETKILIDNDPMFKLQHDKVGKMKADAAKTTLERLIDVQNDQFKNDFDSNSLLRQRNRSRKHRSAELLKEANSIGLSIPLVEPSEADDAGARAAVFKPCGPTSFQASERLKIVGVLGESIFRKPDLLRSASSSGGSIKRRSGSDPLGMDAKKSRLEHDAMKKQAVVKLNPKDFKLATSQDGETASASRNQPLRVNIVARKKSPASEQGERGITQSSKSEISRGKEVNNVTSLLANYGTSSDED